MKIYLCLFAFASALLLGCNNKTPNEVPVEYNSMIQFDVGSAETPEAAYSGDGNIHVAATCYIPVPSKGGSGHVLSYCNGLMVELRWNKVEPLEIGSQSGVVFSGFQWRIANMLRENESTAGKPNWNQPDTKTFYRKFKTLISSVPLKRFSNSKEPGAYQMIRARWLPKMIEVPEIHLKNDFNVADND